MSTRRLIEELRGSILCRSAVHNGTASTAVPPSGVNPLGPPARGVPVSLPPARRAAVSPPRDAASPRPIERPRPQPIQDPALLEGLKRSTPAKVGVGRAGLRYRTQTLLQFAVDFAIAKAAVESQVPEGWAEAQGWLPLETAAESHEQFLVRPDLGRLLSEASLAAVRERCARGPDVQIVVGDGLSATAVIENAPETVRVLGEELARRGRSVGTLLFVRHCRSKIVDVVGQETGARVGVILCGERPGLGTGDGMSAYLVYQPGLERTEAEKQAVSNIHRRGLLPEDAGRHLANVIEAILTQQTSGVGLDLKGIQIPQSGRGRVNQAHDEPLTGCGQSHGQTCAACRDGRPGEVCRRDDGRPCLAVARP